MGQKVNPNGFRFGVTKKHNVNWYADKSNFASYLLEDVKIREYVEKFVREYQIGKVEIKRDQNNKVTLIIHTAKPGVVLGQGGETVKKLTSDIQKYVKNKKLVLNIEVLEIAKPELNARLAAEQIAIKLENRGSFRVAQKTAIKIALKAGAKGIKTQVSGRLNGVEMARSEGYSEGEMKLHTLRQNVDYAQATAHTTYGALGVKVWISLGEVKEGEK
ncbi:30S ribosomal protein S3 [Mesomycoplasma lagogenitalium]|uniref:Small ribosomal subunit protein uS3 n=1 Tax=Mesomycoplasma lagogenitalium TaxID=171286 RepID=A0ABY8LWT3_9BACT|nr:30S ribosomal protein S3 [Mesomycoplasma lagogenitalium]WGI36582.1 30S ribosomal protein S3 [Mesomycoplasma lagogenitalium]